MDSKVAGPPSFSVRRSLAWMALSQGILFVLQFGTSLVVARLLTPYEMGIFAVAAAVVGILSVVRAVGLSSYVVRATTIDAPMLASVFTINALIALTVATLVLGASLLGGLIFAEDGVRRALMVLALTPILSTLELLPSAQLERDGRFKAIAAVSVARTVVGTIVTLGLAFAGASYMSLVWGQVAAAVTSSIALVLVGWRYGLPRLGLSGWQDILRFGTHILAITGVTILAARMAEIVLGRVLGLGALGLYSRASSLNAMLWESVHMVINRVVMVDFADQARRGRGLHDSYLATVRMVTALLWPAFAGMAVVAGPVVMLLYGEPWVGAALPLSLLSIASMLLTSITMTWEVYVVSHQTARQARIEFIRAGVGFFMFVLGCLGGIAGAAAARVADAVFSLGLYRRDMLRMTGTRLGEIGPIYLSSAGLTLVAVAPAAAVMTWHGWSPATPFAAVLGAVLLGVLGWAAAIVVTGHPLAAEGRRLLAVIRRR